MSKLIEPPSFISETKSFETYKKDLERWAQLTTLDPTKQALLVVHMLDGDPSGIKEKIDENVDDNELNSSDGISKLLEFLKDIYEKDSLSDGFEKYIAFEKFRRSSGKSIQEFIPEWTTAYKKAKNIGCVLPDKVLSFKLLDAANLTQIERNLVLTGVDYEEDELLEQMQTALKKFIGRSALGQKEEQSSVDSTYLTADNFETVLLSKGWTKPRGGGRGGGRGRGGKREREAPDEQSQEKRRKNYIGRDGKISKCYKCTCKHETECDCECTYHLAHRCPGVVTKDKVELSLFMQSNIEAFNAEEDADDFVLYIQTSEAGSPSPDPEQIGFPSSGPEQTGSSSSSPMEIRCPSSVPEQIRSTPSVPEQIGSPSSVPQQMVSNSLPENVCEEYDLALIVEDVCLFTQDTANIAFIDSACPTTVAGEKWFKNFVQRLPAGNRINLLHSERMYKFGGGERRKSKGIVKLPCILGEKLKTLIQMEIVDADIPLLIGNSSLKKGKAIMYIGDNKIDLKGCKLDMGETKSGHFSLKVSPPQDLKVSSKATIVEHAKEEIICLAAKASTELDLKDVEKLHHYWGHCSVEKLEILIKNSGKLTGDVKKCLATVKKNCVACKVITNRRPRQIVAIPRATRRNQIVTMDLKEYEDGRYILYLIDMFTRFTVGVFITNKKAETISEAVLRKWISVFGVMEVLHSDGGKEFNNEELSTVAEHLNVKTTSTAAYSPNQNGCNERNHAIVDRMMTKMKFQDQGLKPEIALCWALNAKNSLENYQGFSPAQLVFGENPKLPALYSAGPPGLEEVNVSKSAAMHISALHLAREAFI